MTEPLLRFSGVEKHFALHKGLLRRKVGEVAAVGGIDLSVIEGETLALVGESGCGKSTTARLAMAAFAPCAGEITLRTDGGPLAVHELRGAARKRLWRDVQLIFQDPYTSLNPRMNVRQILAEPLRNFGIATGRAADAQIAAMLDRVGLPPSAMTRFPHAFSGGQRQRIGIARALIVAPRLVIGDEPVSALDVSVGAQIINLFADLKDSLGLTYLLISHDLSLVRHASDRTAVMYMGRIVETGPTAIIFDAPRHPYTQALIAASPKLNIGPVVRRAVVPDTDVAPRAATAGCAYHPQCPLASDLCRHSAPPRQTGPDGRELWCHNATPQPKAARAVPLPVA